MAKRFRCKRCNYRFGMKGEREPNRCPNCGKDELLTEEDINTILKDPELDSYDW